MRALLQSLAPNSFDDVAAVVALYRPGPMSANMHYDYADYKNQRKQPDFFHPDARDLLADTYGLMVYQESVMRVAQKFAGYSLAEADNLRKACGKKIPELMAKERDRFESGCEDAGYGSTLGRQLFDVIEKFADYAFNKSHAYGYGLIAYQTAYLKAHYPVEYIACLLSSVKGNFDKAAVYLADARSSSIEIRTPDINLSRSDFIALTAQGERAVSFGLSAIRNVGEGLVGLLLAERDENGPYESFHDFVERAPEQVLNKRTVESLIKAGAFDSLGHPRRGLLMVFEQIIDVTVDRRREREKGIMSLFGEEMAADSGFSDRIEIPALQFDKTDQLRNEKDMLGLYISDHPLMGIEHSLRRRVDCSIGEARERDDGTFVVVGGVITNLARKYTKRGDQMAVFVLEDLDSGIEVTIFPKTLAEVGHLLRDDAIVAVRGRLDRRDDARVGVMAQKIEVLENLGVGPRRVTITRAAAAIDEATIDRLRAILTEFPGDAPVYLDMGADNVIRLGDEFSIDLDRAIGDLRVAFGDDVTVS
jgi:DNA polymerase-3 subunit alpha